MKIYLIDSENVVNYWISDINKDLLNSKVFYFFTVNSKKLNADDLALLKKYNTSFTPIECSTGKNALDFQLCTELGHIISKHKKDDFIVVSNDTGYDAVIKYWQTKNNINISRRKINTNAKAKQLETITIAPKYGTAQDIFYILGTNNLADIHSTLNIAFKKGTSIYKAIKKDPDLPNYIQQHPQWTCQEKKTKYLQILLHDNPNSAGIIEFYQTLAPEEKLNKSFLFDQLKTKYGQDGLNSYRCLKFCSTIYLNIA